MQSLLKEGVSIAKYHKLTEKEIFQKIKSINFNGKKAHYIKQAVDRIVNDLDGKVPNTLKGLTAFKGIGNKVAHIILQQGFEKSEGVAVDVHVHRICNRLGWVKAKNPDGTMEQLNALFDKEDYLMVNHDIVGFGQILCTKNNPGCIECPVGGDCDYGKKAIPRLMKMKKEKRLKLTSGGALRRRKSKEASLNKEVEEEDREGEDEGEDKEEVKVKHDVDGEPKKLTGRSRRARRRRYNRGDKNNDNQAGDIENDKEANNDD